MDRTLSYALAVLVVATAVFLVFLSLSVYMGTTYRNTLSSTYEYRVSIANDATLGNMTLYLPIPSGEGPENSAILEGIGAGGLAGVPPGWRTSLIGTEKFTMLEVTAPEVAPAPVGKPYLLSITTPVRGPIRTREPVPREPVLAPLAKRSRVTCGVMDAGASPEMRCEMYQSPVYADFTSPGTARLAVFVSLDGKNTWDVFGPSSSEYQDGLEVSFSREAQGWQTGNGVLVTGIGDYGLGFWVGEGAA
jgi:hypothetical protein